MSTSTVMGPEDVAAAGDHAAERFEALFREHQRDVFGWIMRIVRDCATAEDLTIETFWRIHRGLGTYDASRPFAPWARTIATRVALEWMRRERPTVALSDGCTELSAEREGDPAEASETRAAVAEAFLHLPPKLRIAATLVVLEEIPQKEAAAALGISVAAVKVRVFRALRLLRKELKEKGITP